jgi:uncharacterized phiE125 gp8 family phage protein
MVVSLVASARAKVERDCGIALLSQTYDLTFDAFPSDAIRLPLYPLQSVTSITVTNVAGQASAVTASNYFADTASVPPRIVLADGGAWPTNIRVAGGIVVRFVAGYTTPAAIPEPLLTAIKHATAVFYGHASTMPGALPPRWLGYDSLIAPYRLPGLA